MGTRPTFGRGGWGLGTRLGGGTIFGGGGVGGGGGRWEGEGGRWEMEGGDKQMCVKQMVSAVLL